MIEVSEGSIKVVVLEMIPLNVSERPKHYLLSFKLIDGTKHLPPVRKVVTEHDDIRQVLRKEIEVYKSLKEFTKVIFHDATR